MNKLEQIYHDLSMRKLSSSDALEKIRRLKLKHTDNGSSVLFSAASWQKQVPEIKNKYNKVNNFQHHIIFDEILEDQANKLESLVSGSHCLKLPRTNSKNIVERYTEITLICFSQLQSILKSKPKETVLIQLVFSNDLKDQIFIGLTGLLKTAQLENPHIRGQIIFVETGATSKDIAKQLLEDQHQLNDFVIRYHQTQKQVLCWQEIPSSQISVQNELVQLCTFKERGVYLVTGGLGSLGVIFIKEIMKQTSIAKIIITGRSALSKTQWQQKQQELFGEFPDSSIQLEYNQLDLSSLTLVKQLIALIKNKYQSLNGILHCAGMTSDNFILNKSLSEFRRVLVPKVDGTFNLDQATQQIDLDFIALFSSIASWSGNLGQADYAAANGFMDQFAVYRNHLVETKQRRGQTLSINWPLWQDGGIQLEENRQAQLERTTGILPLESLKGIQAFYQSITFSNDQVLVLVGEQSNLAYQLQQQSLVLASEDKSISIDTESTDTVGADIASYDLLSKTQAYLCQQFSKSLKISIDRIDPKLPLEQYGIDSILAMNLTSQLEKTFGSLSKTLFFEYLSIAELSDYFVESYSEILTALLLDIPKSKTGIEKEPFTNQQIFNSEIKSSAKTAIHSRRRKRLDSVVSQVSSFSAKAEPIAIVGLSGRYSESKNIEEFWHNLKEGNDCIVEVPKERWKWQDYHSEDRTQSNKHYSKWGGFIAGVDEFDPRFFNISPREAESIDPQERLFLQHAWMAVEDAGYTRNTLQIPNEHGQAGQVGVYVGVMYGEYNRSGSLASIANRVSYVLNLHGPCMTLDTMCSSSLTSIHLACQDLKQGRTSLAIAGGVNVSIHPNKYLMLSAGQFISSDGHCQSFGEGGDGYIPGEGIGAVVLKRLSEAKKDRNSIYGIIKGSVLNHGGKTNGYSVPNPKAQADVIGQALTESNIEPSHISYIEAHGTGTKLGDPIEIVSLCKAFYGQSTDTAASKSNKAYGFCTIGSAKSNIGHCESAAGIAGITKVLLQMKHKKIVPSLHSEKLNPNIDFQNTPFVVNQTLKDWQQPVVNGITIPRIAGVSSFGAGGSNAHIILEEYQPPSNELKEQQTIFNGEVIILLSARTKHQLSQKVGDLLVFISQSENIGSSLDLISLAYTLQIGREAMKERVGFIVRSIEQLAIKIESYINSDKKSDIEGVYRGMESSDKNNLSSVSNSNLQQVISSYLTNKKYFKLLKVWVDGSDVDWNNLYHDVNPSLISLPPYPFAKEKYWIDPTAGEMLVAKKTATLQIHPLLHTNVSDLDMQSYSSTFNGDETFIKAHLPEQKTLSDVSYLEMIRIALDQTFPAESHSNTVELHNTKWGLPAVISDNNISDSNVIKISIFSNSSEQVNYEIYSQKNQQEVIHCQGTAIYTEQKVSEKLSLTRLKKQMDLTQSSRINGIKSCHRGENKLLIELGFGTLFREGNQSDFVLNPNVIDSALNAVIHLIGIEEGSFSLQKIETVRIISACTKQMFAFVHFYSDISSGYKPFKLDLDLCDEHGNVCVQLLGVDYQKVLPSSINLSVQGDKTIQGSVINSPNSLSDDKFIPKLIKQFKIELMPELIPNTLAKPEKICLVNPAVLTTSLKVMKNKNTALVMLAETGTEAISLENIELTSSVNLFDLGQGVFQLEVAASVNRNKLSKKLIEQILSAFDRVKKEPTLKVLILSGTNEYFLAGERENYEDAIELELYNAVTSFPYPTIAAMRGDAKGVGFLSGMLCDFMILSTQASYCYSDERQVSPPSAIENQLYGERLGHIIADDFMLFSSESLGQQLSDKGWTCPILTPDEVDNYAKKLAKSLATKTHDTLRLLKQHLSRHISQWVKELTLDFSERFEDQSISTTNDCDVKVSSHAKNISLQVHANKVLVIRIGIVKHQYGMNSLLADLTELFDQIDSSKDFNSIVLASDYPEFLPFEEQKLSNSVILNFKRLLLRVSVPVVAALDSNANGLSWLISLFCDVCIYNKNGNYSTTNILQRPELVKQASIIFSYRLGSPQAQEILLTGKICSGAELENIAQCLMAVDKNQVLSEALKSAERWAPYSYSNVISWKKESSQRITDKFNQLRAGQEVAERDIETQVNKPTSIDIDSSVVNATAYPEGILLVEMVDKQAKNMFSEALVEGLYNAFTHIEKTPAYKVVVLTGYDNYFASGGTKETLLAIQEGEIKFTDNKIYQLALDCKLPVIAGIQGHGIGAGWALGMFADFILMSEESHYVSPYMDYGFTPGAGSTMIFPARVGYDLARETLLTARQFTGRELKGQRISLSVLPREQVVIQAMKLAKKLTKISSSLLIELKQQWTLYLRDGLAETYQRELEMHELTFVGQSETLEKINHNFTTANTTEQKEQMNIPSGEPVDLLARESREIDSLDSIINSLKQLLAQELYLDFNEISEKSQFVDLGLDSITGVTWIRKINENYGTSIEATKVYSYPSIVELSQYISQMIGGKTGSKPLEKSFTKATVTASHAQTADVLKITSETSVELVDAVNFSTVVEEIKQLLAQELYLEVNEIDENVLFSDLGLDSITGVTWVRIVNEKYNTKIEATKVYGHPTLVEFAQHVKQEIDKLNISNSAVSEVDSSETIRVVKPNLVSHATSNQLVSLRKQSRSRFSLNIDNTSEIQPIAVIGMAGQFPQANNLEMFWENIAQSKNCISKVSQERWDINTYYSQDEVVEGKTNCQWMGALDEYDLFDPLFFNISPADAESMDPQQRLFLQACWHSIENAGYSGQSLSGSQCGVFVGCAGSDYHLLSREQQLSSQSFTGDALSILAARISYFLNLQGPCLSIDTACSSSLVAIANACDSLTSGASDLALAGGVYVMSGPEMHIKTSQSGMLSTDGKCFTFDQRANGFVPGEGVGVVVLKRLADAQSDNDIVQGLIQGWGVNQDGKTNGITAPNANAQKRLEQTVYDKYNIDPAAIQLIEAHGTGTKLGDPIEIEGLKESFKDYTDKVDYCAVGSVKSNIGHCLTAAGISGFIKLMLALKHKQLPPTINFEQINEHIDLDNSPFYINKRLQSWELNDNQSRLAALSSFGFSGTNAHMVIGEYSAPQNIQKPDSVMAQCMQFLIPLSAKTSSQLKQKAIDLLAFIQTETSSIDLTELTYTLQIGRDGMEERLGFVVSSIEQLSKKLEKYIDANVESTAEIKGCYQGRVQSNKEAIRFISQDEEMRESFIAQMIAGHKLSKVLELWVKGLEWDWLKLYGQHKPQKISLPLYPFAKERYWIETSKTKQELAAIKSTAAINDLELHAISGLSDTDMVMNTETSINNKTLASIPTEQPTEESSEALFFQERWKPQSIIETPIQSENKQTIIFTDSELESEINNNKVFSQVTKPITVTRGKSYRKISSQVYECCFNNLVDIQKVLSQVSTSTETPIAIIYTWAKGQGEAGIHALLELFKAIKTSKHSIVHVTLVGHYDPQNADTCWDYSWIGFERSLKLLLPKVEISLLYTNTSIYNSQQLAEASNCTGVNWYKDEQRLSLSYEEFTLDKTAHTSILKNQGHYLITGGCGALGLKFAHYLAKTYQAKLLLIGRSILTTQIKQKLAELKLAGAKEVHYQSVDIGDREALLSWKESYPIGLSGIIHAAGVESSQYFDKKSLDDINQVMRPKTVGSQLLDELFADEELDFVCYFSSSAAILGDVGACDYSIANRFQMAYGHYRLQTGYANSKTLVINWPLWQSGGMGQSNAEQTAFYLKSSGQQALSTDKGIELWETLMSSSRSQALVMIGQPTRVQESLRRTYHPEKNALIESASSKITAITGKGWKPQYEDLSLKNCLIDNLKQQISVCLKIEMVKLENNTNLADYGFDSINLAKFAKQLTAHFELEISPSIFFSYTTIQQLSDYFIEEYSAEIESFYSQAETYYLKQNSLNEKETVASKSIVSQPLSQERQLSRVLEDSIVARVREPIAIIGMSGRFPQAESVDELWTLLAEGQSGIKEIPSSRWDWRDYFSHPGDANNTISTNKGGFIAGVDEFDPLFFEISPKEAEEMDPSERILLMESYKAIEDARISPASLKGKKVGVFVGMEESQYGSIAKSQGVTTGGNAMVSSRLSYYLDLHGPTLAINTACSSGLVALHQASMSLRQGECETALAAGVALSLLPENCVKMSQAGMLSQDGECFSFSSKANGIGVGEAVVVLMLKPLSKAIEAGDPIYGAIKASGINFDGKTNGVTAPNGKMQAALIEEIYSSHNISVDSVSHIVSHGTGTKLGDPVELNALISAFKKLSDKQASGSSMRCAVTSCKSNLGHTMAASGLVSLVSLLKGMQHGQIPASLHCEEENDYIHWEDGPFYINKTTQPWETGSGTLRMGGVSAFGRSGTNAHVVIEEVAHSVSAHMAIIDTTEHERVLIPLSARTESRLKQRASDLLDFIIGHPSKVKESEASLETNTSINLSAMAFSLQVSREEMEQRVGFIVNSVQQLTEKLQAYLNGSQMIEDSYQGKIQNNNEGINFLNQDEDMAEAIDKWIARKKLSKLLELWIKGLDLNWFKLYGDKLPQRISLPTYPFAKEKYWVASVDSDQSLPDSPITKIDIESIENIINGITDETIETEQAVELLNALV
jgi:acyl transferase domain-containing protein/enoyl-CoA hydratase/carnithine racemase/acyl carrier protein